MADTISPTVFIGRPRGGEVLTVGSTVTIQWGSRDNVGVTSHDVLFSSNGGGTYTAIVTNLPGKVQSTDWTVPNTPTTAGKIRVVARDAAGNQGSGDSGSFTIKGTPLSVTVTSPNGSEVFEATMTHTITWTATGNVTSQDVLYSTDGGTSFSEIATDLRGDLRSFDWRVACDPTSAGRIRVVVRDGAGESSDISDGNFTITSFESQPPLVTVSFPNGGEVLTTGGTYVITWTASDNVCVASQDLYSSSDGGATFSLIAANVPGDVRSFSWTALTTETTAGRIKVVAGDAAGNKASDMSNGNFTIQSGPPDITPPSVTVTQPNGGEQLAAGSFYTIQWTASDDVGVASQDVLFSADGGVTFDPIVTALSGGARSLNWTVPSIDTDLGRIRVMAGDAAGNEASDLSDDNFSIVVLPGDDPIPPTVDLLSPNGGEILVAGDTYKIKWSSEDNDGVVSHDLYYSTDSGVTFTLIAANLSSITKNYLWNVPATTTGDLRIEVVARDPAGNEGSDVSDADCDIFTSSALSILYNRIHTGIIPEPVDYAGEEGFAPELQTGESEETAEESLVNSGLQLALEDLESSSSDSDEDGINDDIEEMLATAFAPAYQWDKNEPNNFTHLAPGVLTLVATDFVSHTTPLIYYSVRHVANCTFNTDVGPRCFKLIRLNYMAIWDHDSGLCGGGCNFKSASSHQWDVERVELVVALPFNLSLNDGTLRNYFLIGGWAYAHEGVLCFHRKIWGQRQNPITGGEFHARVWWAKSKHGHFWFNPNNLLMYDIFDPRCPVIGICCPFEDFPCIIADCRFCVPCYIVDPLVCFVECFENNQNDKSLPNELINVGEPGSPMNGAIWNFEVDNVRRAVGGSFRCFSIPGEPPSCP